MAEIQTYLYGKKFPNRIFVGGLPLNTNAYELAKFFNFFGHVTESKIILDESGLSKGYGFVTFEQKSTVRKVESMGIIYFKNKKINIGPAVKKESATVQPETVLLPHSYPVTSTATNVIDQQTMQSPYYNNLGYSQQPQQSLEPLVGADHYGYYQVTNHGIYWMMYPYGPVVNQNVPQVPYSSLPRDYRSNSASSNGSSDEEIKIKRYCSKRKDIPPRFMKK